MGLYLISYCIDSKKMYRGHDETSSVSDLGEAIKLLDMLSEDDTLYIDVLDTKDAININGDSNGKIFLEINTVKGGVFSKDMSVNEVIDFLNNITLDFKDLDLMGFSSSSI